MFRLLAALTCSYRIEFFNGTKAMYLAPFMKNFDIYVPTATDTQIEQLTTLCAPEGELYRSVVVGYFIAQSCRSRAKVAIAVHTSFCNRGIFFSF